MSKHKKSILITGGCGFIGSNFVPYMLSKYPNYKIINLDLLTYAGDRQNLKEIENHSNYYFEQGDICDRSKIENLFKTHDIRGVIHFAAESHVDNSIKGPELFLQTNIMGTFTLLDVARHHWMDAPSQYKAEYKGCRFHHISTDEVYGTLGETGLFKETTAYAPNSPYSASKASSDFIARSYNHTYGMNVTISNCSNNYGPKQHAEKLIPTVLRNALSESPIPIYGDGKNIRDWLYVIDHCTGIDNIYHNGQSGETYNIGGKNELTNLELTHHICNSLDTLRPRQNGQFYKELIHFVTDRAGHDRRYAIDASKIENNLGWRADENFKTGIAKTIEWYLTTDKSL
jgi:dTDP-glucose 4,6-dehydratase